MNTKIDTSKEIRLAQIQEQLQNLPELPGIYKLLDIHHNILYIGKSKCLKKRVKSYFVASPKWEKVKKFVNFIYYIDIIVTDTHLEARLLECKLIKEIQPHFNSQMKNDQRYCYLKVTDCDTHHPLQVVYEREPNTFGPFRKKQSLLNIIHSFENLYPIERTGKSYSLEYHIVPVTLALEEFQTLHFLLIDLLQENKNLVKLIAVLEHKMKDAASDYKFETASMYRDVIFSLNHLKYNLQRYKHLMTKTILLCIPVTNGKKLFFIHKGKIIQTKLLLSVEESTYESCKTNTMIEDFIMESRQLVKKKKQEFWIESIPNEKSNIDFQDILYSEISVLPEETIRFL